MSDIIAGVALKGGFPNPVNETSARLVAAGVVLQSIVFLVVQSGWLLVPLFLGFVARVIAGPRFSPLGRFVTALVTPRLRIRHRFVPGQPKRFAQGIGVAFSGGAALAWLLGSPLAALVLVAGLTAAATLESVFAVCLGCIVFGQLMRWRLIPESICIECADISARLRQALAERAA
jgi:hypothetical protein